MKNRTLRSLAAALFLMLFWGLTGCETAPEPVAEAPDEAPAEEPDVEETPPVQPPGGLSQEEIDAAEQAIARAGAMGAPNRYPDDFQALQDELAAALALAETDSDAAREALDSVISNANGLHDAAMAAHRSEYETRLSRGESSLLSIEADRFAPDRFEGTHQAVLTALALFGEGDIPAAQTRADEALALQSTLYFNLSENLRYIEILKRDSENYLADAEDNEAFLHSPAELDAANTHYLAAQDAFADANLELSAREYTEAKRFALLAARAGAVRRQQSETDSLMEETQRRLEDASRISVLGSDGTVVEARPWDGEEFLGNNPLTDPGRDIEGVEVEIPELRSLDAPIENADSDAPQDIPIRDEGTQVNGDHQDTDYLDVATRLWEKGVNARNAGQFDLAQDYFRQAQAHIDVHEANAISRTYTVVRRERATDCLWRIAARSDVFGNAYLWPKIWRANRRFIQNPDLIFPGQVLAVPPK